MTLTYPRPFDWLAPVFAFISAFLESFNLPTGTGELEVIPEAEEAPAPTREEIDERSKASRARLFGDDDGDPPKEKPPEKPKKEDPPKKEEPEDNDTEEEEEDEDEETDDTEDGDEDYESDADDKPVKKAPGEEEADDTEEGTVAEKQARTNGRLAKKLKVELAEAKLKLKTHEDELKETKARLEEFNKVTIDPRSTTEYRSLNDAMWDDVDAAIADELPRSAVKLADHFAPYMKTYIKASGLKGEERLAAVDTLKAQIVKDLGGFDDPFDELVDEEHVAADTLAKSVLSIIRRNHPRATEMISLEAKLNERAKVGRLAHGAKEYERARSGLLPLIDGIGKLDDKLVEEAPYSSDAVITQMVKDNPKMAKRLESAKADVLELLQGPQPLSDKEYAELEDQNADIKEIVKARKDRHDAKLKKFLPLLVKGLFATSFTNKTLETIAREAREKADERDDLDLLADIESKRKAPKSGKTPKKEEPKIPARERPLASSRLFD